MAIKEGDPILESLETSPEEEEITLSDSELDDVLNSAEITTEAGGDTLEQYGVWVKAEPQEIDVPGDADLNFELADLGSGSDTEANLTEEEEQLLGELESDSEVGEGLSVLEDDLEELGKGAAEPEESAEGGLEVDIEDLGTGSPGPAPEAEELQLEEMPEDFPDLEAETLDGLDSLDAGETFASDTDRYAEIEVPLSDRSAVEEHYEDLAPLEGVPSTPGMSPPNILERIEKDLSQIKAEIQSLKNELAGMAGGGTRKADVKPPPATAGSFEKGEDDTIALTGDELDNILNTADITEETAEPAEEETLEGLDELDSLQAPEELSLEEESSAESSLELEDEGIPELGADLEDIPEAAGAPELSLDQDILEPGSLDLPEEALEEIPTASDEPFGELQQEGEEGLGEIGEIGLEEEAVPELTEEISLQEAGSGSVEDLETLGELEIPEMPGEEPIEELSLEEPPEELSIEELSPAGEQAAEPLAELESTENIPEIELADEGFDAEAQAPTEEFELAEEAAGSGEPQTAGQGGVAALPKELQSDIRSVLSYLDQLLEALPNEKIQEFAQSQYFGIYKRLFEELGLGA